MKRVNLAVCKEASRGSWVTQKPSKPCLGFTLFPVMYAGELFQRSFRKMLPVKYQHLALQQGKWCLTVSHLIVLWPQCDWRWTWSIPRSTCVGQAALQRKLCSVVELDWITSCCISRWLFCHGLKRHCSLADVDGLITQALLTGNFESAVDLCLHDNRMADAIILAIAGGQELLSRTQEKYFVKMQSKITRVCIFS